VCNDRRRGNKKEWDANKPVKSRKRSLNPVTITINWAEDKNRWYVHAAVKDVAKLNTGPKKADRKDHRHYVLSLDLNVNHIAYSLVKPDGNPLPKHTGKIPLLALGTQGQKLDSIGRAVQKIIKLHAAYESKLGEKVIICAEILNFQNAKQELRYHSPKVANKLSSFAYSRFGAVLDKQCALNNIELRRVGAAWSSVIGQLNHANPYGLSVDIASTIPLARRALGMNNNLRPQVKARYIARVDIPKAQMPVQASLGQVRKMVKKRPHTWNKSNWLLSRQEPIQDCHNPSNSQTLNSLEDSNSTSPTVGSIDVLANHGQNRI
jgi:hypothetical protein